jgi:hypothetical protein
MARGQAGTHFTLDTLPLTGRKRETAATKVKTDGNERHNIHYSLPGLRYGKPGPCLE